MAELTMQIINNSTQKEIEVLLDGKNISQHFAVPLSWTDTEIFDYVKAKCVEIGYSIE